jgi:uncharacterized protein YdhG (YjbR/CyaY superfamily)
VSELPIDWREEAAPDATETISYAIPTFDLNGKHLVHFAGFEKHLGFYPTPSGIEAFKEELKPTRARGFVQFPLTGCCPDLIRRIIEFRVKESTDAVRSRAPTTTIPSTEHHTASRVVPQSNPRNFRNLHGNRHHTTSIL